MLKGGTSRGFSSRSDFYRSPFSRGTKSAEGKLYGFPNRDLDAENLLNRMTNVDKGLEYSIYNLIVNIKKDQGIKNLSDVFDCLYVFAADTQTNALLNWVSTSFDCTVVSPTTPITFTQYKGFSTGTHSTYVSTNYTPSTQAVRYQLNNAAIGLYITNTTAKPATGTQYAFSALAPGVLAWFDQGVGYTLNGGASALTGTNTQQPWKGLISCSRTSNATFKQQNKGLDISNAQVASTAVPTTVYSILARVGTANNFITDTVGMAFIGSGDINIQSLNRRVQEYMQSIGAAQ